MSNLLMQFSKVYFSVAGSGSCAVEILTRKNTSKMVMVILWFMGLFLVGSFSGSKAEGIHFSPEVLNFFTIQQLIIVQKLLFMVKNM